MFYRIYGFEYLVIALIISVIASTLIQNRYKKYRRVRSDIGITGYEAARLILRNNNLNHVKIDQVAGVLTDHFDPRDQSISLSKEVYSSTSIASIAVAAHEVGHAIQHSQDYFFLKLRSALVPVTNFATNISYLLILLGLLVSPSFGKIGVIMFLIIFIFQLVTLPVEVDASRRALKELEALGISQNDAQGAKSMLSAAALTYVSAMVTALMNLLRISSLFVNRRD